VKRLALVFGLLALALGSQPLAQGNEVRFRSGTDLVVLHVAVRDRRGAFLEHLPKSAFSVLEDGRPQHIETFTTQDVPVTVGLVVDASVSMWAVRDRVIAAVETFAATSHPDDELFALAFNEHVTAALPESAPFTSDPAVLKNALSAAVNARGKTALYDAVSNGLDYLDKGSRERKVLVLISDGGDNASRTSFQDVLQRTQTSNVVIYAVALPDPADPDANPKILRELARTSGGQMIQPSDARDVSRSLTQIALDIRHVYTVGYAPARAADDSYRRITVNVAPPDRQRVTVRTRAGYRAIVTTPRVPESDASDVIDTPVPPPNEAGHEDDDGH